MSGRVELRSESRSRRAKSVIIDVVALLDPSVLLLLRLLLQSEVLCIEGVVSTATQSKGASGQQKERRVGEKAENG